MLFGKIGFLTPRRGAPKKIRSLNTSGHAFWKNRIFNRASRNTGFDLSIPVVYSRVSK
jgi:hypothetical protein